jgi:hypothetical protein
MRACAKVNFQSNENTESTEKDTATFALLGYGKM